VLTTRARSSPSSSWAETTGDALRIHDGEALPCRRRLETLVRGPKLDRSSELRAEPDRRAQVDRVESPERVTANRSK
jgi:hypothetical protein